MEQRTRRSSSAGQPASCSSMQGGGSGESSSSNSGSNVGPSGTRASRIVSLNYEELSGVPC